jgi:hypothetical protein
MRKRVALISLAVFALTISAFAGVSISSPSPSGTVQSPVRFVASATTPVCSAGVAGMGVYDNNILMTTTSGSKMDTQVSLTDGTHNNVVVQYWDFCGHSAKERMSIKVNSSAPKPHDDVPSDAKTFANVEEMSGWIGYGELKPKFAICTDCRPKVTWGFKQGISSPSLTGNAMRFDIGGTQSYSDALFINHMIGDGSTRGMPDNDGKIISSIHHIIFDVYFYTDHLERSQALEFDMSLNIEGRAHQFGTECINKSNKVWALWDNAGHRWVMTDVPCEMLNAKWNHLVLKFQRTTDNHLIYESITLNDKVHTLNWLNNSRPSNWHGFVVNFQMDGFEKQEAYSVYLDKLNITYY